MRIEMTKEVKLKLELANAYIEFMDYKMLDLEGSNPDDYLKLAKKLDAIYNKLKELK